MARRLHQIRDCVVRVEDPVGGGVGTGHHADDGLRRPARHRPHRGRHVPMTNPRALCVIGVAQQTTPPPGPAPEPLDSWEQVAQSGRCRRRRAGCARGDRLAADRLLPELAVRRPDRPAGRPDRRDTRASVLLRHRWHDAAADGRRHRRGDESRRARPRPDRQCRGARDQAGRETGRREGGLEPPRDRALAVPVAATPSRRARARGVPGLGDVPVVGHRPPGRTRRLARRLRRTQRRDHGGDDPGRGRQPLCLGPDRSECRRDRDGRSAQPLRRVAVPEARGVGHGRRHGGGTAGRDGREGRCAGRSRRPAGLSEQLGLRRGPGGHRRAHRHGGVGSDVGDQPGGASAPPA